MTDLIQKIFAPSYENNSIDSYRSLNNICLFRELSRESNVDGTRSKVLLLAHRDWSTGHLYLEAKKASEINVIDHIEQFFFGSKSLLNVQKVFKRVIEEGRHSIQSVDVEESIEDSRTLLNAKITKRYPQDLSSIMARVAIQQLAPSNISEHQLIRMQNSALADRGARLENPGNFCFFNASMKALWATPAVRTLIEARHLRLLQIGERADEPMVALLEQVITVFDAVSSTPQYASQVHLTALTQQLIQNFGFYDLLGSGRQQDACEFIDRFLQTILPDFSMNYFPISVNPPVGTTTSLGNFVLERSPVSTLVPIQIARNIDGVTRSKAIIEIPNAVRSQDHQITHLLRSVIVHSGTKASSGHYYSFVPNYATMNEHGICTQWTKHDDSSISSVRYYEIKEDLERNGYLAMYEKLELL